MRAAATWFLDQPVPLGHETVKLFAQDFRQFLSLLIPHLEQRTGSCPEDDVPAKVALAGIGEARRRLAAIESTGLFGEVERVKRLARSVVALCDHFDALTGITSAWPAIRGSRMASDRCRTKRPARREARVGPAVSTPNA